MCETPAVFNAKAARARKRYHCCECDAWIEPGDIYESAFGVWAGRAGTYRTSVLMREEEKRLARKEI
jgi:hypothetical protein